MSRVQQTELGDNKLQNKQIQLNKRYYMSTYDFTGVFNMMRPNVMM